MTVGEVEILRRAHALFAGANEFLPVGTAAGGPYENSLVPRTAGAAGAGATAYRTAAVRWHAELTAAQRTDTELLRILAEAHRDHLGAHRATAAVLAAARADSVTTPADPIAARELLRRRLTRLRNQRGLVLAARRRARRRRAALLALRYRRRSGRAARWDTRAVTAVRAALSRLGSPYVWGATGPDRFDCSGLVKWAYAQAGIRLNRTTFEQINDGVPVAPGQVRAGDLVFPHAGHVQLAIGGNLVVEAPHPGATVQISRLGENVAIRRPV